MANERLSKALEAELERLWDKVGATYVPNSVRDGYLRDLRKLVRMAVLDDRCQKVKAGARKQDRAMGRKLSQPIRNELKHLWCNWVIKHPFTAVETHTQESELDRRWHRDMLRLVRMVEQEERARKAQTSKRTRRLKMIERCRK